MFSLGASAVIAVDVAGVRGGLISLNLRTDMDLINI